MFIIIIKTEVLHVYLLHIAVKTDIVCHLGFEQIKQRLFSQTNGCPGEATSNQQLKFYSQPADGVKGQETGWPELMVLYLGDHIE